MSASYVSDTLNIDIGERIHVRSLVKPVCDADIPFTIRTARWELIDPYGSIESEGECAINEHELDAFISPEKTGKYYLRYIYEIADETWVDKVTIKVG